MHFNLKHNQIIKALGFSNTILIYVILFITNTKVFSQTPDVCGMVDYCHSRVNDKNGLLDTWHSDDDGPFHTIIDLNMKWWKNTPDVSGWPAYCTAAELGKNYKQYNGAIPASTCTFGIIACLKYYNYTGQSAYKDMAIRMGDYIVQQCLTPDSYIAYPSFPMPVGVLGDIRPNGFGHPFNVKGEVMPDKGAMIGYALLELYKVTGNILYLKCAESIAVVLSNQIVFPTPFRSPWPFRVDADNGETIDGLLCGNQIFAVRLYDGLIRIGHYENGRYQKIRNIVWNWIKTNLITDSSGNNWQNFFEDHRGDEDNPTQLSVMETARYLLEKKAEADSNWFRLAEQCIDIVKKQWTLHKLSIDGYTTIGEQKMDMSSYNSHTARYGSILAMYYESGGASFEKEDAYHALCYGVYSVENDGYTNTYYKNGRYAWTTDSFGDFAGHYMDAFAAVPEWAGSAANHLLRSTSTIKDINYNRKNIEYTSFESEGTEKLKLLSAPKSVKLDGWSISSWLWDKSSKLLVIQRLKGSHVEINF